MTNHEYFDRTPIDREQYLKDRLSQLHAHIVSALGDQKSLRQTTVDMMQRAATLSLTKTDDIIEIGETIDSSDTTYITRYRLDQIDQDPTRLSRYQEGTWFVVDTTDLTSAPVIQDASRIVILLQYLDRDSIS